jgi:hypothetical protein
MTNRGRFQAQDDTLEKSSAWATNDEVTKQMGHERLNSLHAQLTAAELDVRVTAMQKARLFVDNAPINGHYAQIVKSYFDDVRNREIRVDIEIRAGRAFLTLNN